MSIVLKYMTKFQYEISCDDGCNLDLKTADLLKKYKLDATFYIQTLCELSDEFIKKLSEDFEIGGHTVSHYFDLKQLHDITIEFEIRDNKEWLEKITGKKIIKFSYPNGKYDDRVIGFVRKAGVIYARTTTVLNTEHPADMFRVHPTIHIHPNRKEYKGRDWSELAREYFLKAKEKDGFFHLFFHSWEVQKYKQWNELEEFFKFINNNK